MFLEHYIVPYFARKAVQYYLWNFFEDECFDAVFIS